LKSKSNENKLIQAILSFLRNFLIKGNKGKSSGQSKIKEYENQLNKIYRKFLNRKILYRYFFSYLNPIKESCFALSIEKVFLIVANLFHIYLKIKKFRKFFELLKKKANEKNSYLRTDLFADFYYKKKIKNLNNYSFYYS